MKLDTAITLGKECGLATVEECVTYIQMHALSLFLYSEVTGELEELQTEYEASPEFEPIPRELKHCDVCDGIATWHRNNQCLRCAWLAKGGFNE